MLDNGITAKNKITMTFVADLLLACSILLYSYRGNIGAIVAIFSFVLRFSNGKIKYIKMSNLQKAWMLFILIFAITDYLFRNKNFEFYAFSGYITAISCVIFIRKENVERILKYIYLFSIYIAFTVILQFLLPGIFSIIARIVMPENIYLSIIRRGAGGYITGLTREVSYAALFLVFGLLYTYYKSKSRNKYILCIIWLVLLFVSGKKAQPLFAVMAIFLVTYFQSNSIGRHIKTIFIIILFGLAVVFTYPIWSKISAFNRIVYFIESLSNGMDIIGLTTGRAVIYMRALELWNQNKMFGIGWENFRNFGAYGTSEYTTWFKGFDVHNCYLQILCETGIIGLALFCILFILTTVNVIRLVKIQNKENDNLKLAIAYYLFFWLLALSEPCFYTDAYIIILFIMIGIMFTKTKYNQNVNN